MSRFQLSLNVEDVEAAVDFYSALFGVGPAKHREGYANFAVDNPSLKLVLIEGEGAPGTINHVGIELPDGAAVADETCRVADAGLTVDVDDPHTCCFATQEKAWTRDPGGVLWELYTVVADTDHFGASPSGGTPIDKVAPATDIEELVASIDDPDVVILDAQHEADYLTAHLNGAAHVTSRNLLDRTAELTRATDQRVLIYSTDADCPASESVARRLVDAGYTNVGRFPGGLAEWTTRGLPVESAPAAAW